MVKKLTDAEIQKRLHRLSVIEPLYIKVLKENKELKKRVKQLEAENRQLKREIVDLKIMVNELREMVFGRKNKHKDDDNDSP